MKILSIPHLSLNNVRVISYVNFPPKTLFLLKQGTEKEAQHLVSLGQRVKRGQMIAKAHRTHTQAIHASIGGVVKSIKYIQTLGNTLDSRAIEVQCGGEFSSFNHAKHVDGQRDSITISQDEFLQKIRSSGIYSLDTGDVFDYLSHKFKNSSVTHIIVNAIEFSPYYKLEEKILQLHMKEITVAVHLLMNMFNKKIDNIRCIINSNSMSNRMKFSWAIKNMAGVFPSAYSMKAINFNYDYTPADLHDNYTLITRGLAKKKVARQQKEAKKNILSTIAVQDRSVVLRPSTLLAIYELLMFDKPYIDMYIQMIVGLDNIVVQRVPLGTPLLYLLAPHNKHWKELPSHCFMGDFFNRKILVNTATPVTKNHLHYWLLQDSDFTKLYKRLRQWLEFSNSNLE